MSTRQEEYVRETENRAAVERTAWRAHAALLTIVVLLLCGLAYVLAV